MIKPILSSLLLASMVLSANAQTFAEDWTLSDCASNNHNLFTYLDNEEVVIMEFGMGCSSCTDAAGPILNIRDYFNTTYPGKVKAFYMDYWTGNDCVADVVPITSVYAFDAGFEHVAPQKNYYMTGSPMPAIVIAAGSNHLVIYEKNSFALSDSTDIANAIDYFFNTVGISSVNATQNTVELFPNPAADYINFSNIPASTKLTIVDVSGKVVYSQNNPGTMAQVNVSNLPDGLYAVLFAGQKETIMSRHFMVKH